MICYTSIMLTSIHNTFDTIVRELGYTTSVIEVTRPEPEFGDYTTNVAMQLAGKTGEKPRDIAQKIADELEKQKDIEKVEIAGPGFINIRVRSSVLAVQLEQAISSAPRGTYGASEIGKGKTVVNEFPSPNMAKPYSVGHRRSALQGWAVMKLMQLHGYTTITDNHLGDYGTPFGRWVVGFLRHSSDEALAKDGVRELGRLYIEITKELKDEKAAGKHTIADEVQSWLRRLDTGDAEATAYAKRFSDISRKSLHQTMKRLRIATDHELGESFYVERAQELVDELLTRNIAEMSNGAVIVRLDQYGIETPIMLRKSNGAPLYATTDLATIEYRQKQWSPDKVFIHTGQEQVFYFRQLKALSQKAGFTDTIVHLWHGLVDQKNDDGTRGKMSSRSGVILLDDLLDEAESRAAKLMEAHRGEDVNTVALAAIKFADFTAERHKGLLFDWEKALSLHGFSGPAIQYAGVRAQSILHKAKSIPDGVSEGYDWAAEHQLLLQLHDFPHLLLELHDTYQLHRLASYLYDLTREFNRYYEETSVLGSEKPAYSNRLWLMSVVHKVFRTGLDILGIAIPSSM